MRRPAKTRCCCGCMSRRDKSELVRVVRTPSGAVTVDPIGNADGRGAYLCAQVSCVEAARKKKRLSRVLRTPVEDVVYDEIIARISENGRERS